MKIVDKPAWTYVALAVLGPTGLIAIIFQWWARRARKEVQNLREAPPPKKKPDDDSDSTKGEEPK